MRPMILLSTVPDGPITRVNLEIFDQDGQLGEKCLFRLAYDSGRHPESRPEWAAVYAHRVLQNLVDRLGAELDRDGASLSTPGLVRQTTIQRSSRWAGTDPGTAAADL